MKKVSLFITRSAEHPGYYLVVVSGEGFTGSNGKKVGARVRGDDPVFDDRLFSIDGIGTRVLGGTFSLSKLVHGSQLNEDWGKDEIYAIADVEGSGSYRTNTVTGYY